MGHNPLATGFYETRYSTGAQAPQLLESIHSHVQVDVLSGLSVIVHFLFIQCLLCGFLVGGAELETLLNRQVEISLLGDRGDFVPELFWDNRLL